MQSEAAAAEWEACSDKSKCVWLGQTDWCCSVHLVRASPKGACFPIKREEEDKREDKGMNEEGVKSSHPSKPMGVYQSLRSSDGATLSPQLTSLATDRKV